MKVTVDNLDTVLKGLCVVEVSGESCANCITLMPILKSLIDDRPELKLVHVEADTDTIWFMEKYDIDRVPTILLVDDGVAFAKATGYQPEEILEIWLDAKVEEYKQAK